jgi:hypothetical protein
MQEWKKKNNYCWIFCEIRTLYHLSLQPFILFYKHSSFQTVPKSNQITRNEINKKSFQKQLQIKNTPCQLQIFIIHQLKLTHELLLYWNSNQKLTRKNSLPVPEFKFLWSKYQREKTPTINIKFVQQFDTYLRTF